MATGKVKFFNKNKGFGFITKDSGGDIFMHASDLPEGETPTENTKVSFDIGEAKKGQKATNVRIIE